MSFSQTVAQSIRVGGQDVAQNNAYSADSQTSVDVAIPIEADVLVNFALDVSQIKALFILSDQDLTIETNNAGPDPAPDDTISLVAGVPLVWTHDSYYANLLTTDITALYVTNASAAAARLRIEALHDATP